MPRFQNTKSWQRYISHACQCHIAMRACESVPSLVLLSVLQGTYPEYLPSPHSHFIISISMKQVSHHHIPLLHLPLALCLKRSNLLPPQCCFHRSHDTEQLGDQDQGQDQIQLTYFFRANNTTNRPRPLPSSCCLLSIRPLFGAIVHDRHQLSQHTSTP